VTGAAPLGELAASRGEVGELAAAMAPMNEAMERETTRNRAILGGVSDGIVTISRDGIIEDVNPAFERLFGYSLAELVGQRIEMLIPADIAPQHQQFLDRATSDSSAPRAMAGNRDVYGLCRDGTQVPLEISVSSVEYSGTKHFIGAVRDISARKQAEAQRVDLIAALERSNAELDTFAYVASHDLRGQLGAMRVEQLPQHGLDVCDTDRGESRQIDFGGWHGGYECGRGKRPRRF
jgi:PAS domain S-box-containing protein